MKKLLSWEEWIIHFISFELTLTSLMLAAASFLAGQYLSESRKLGIKKRLNILSALIFVLIIIPLWLTIMGGILISVSDLLFDIRVILLIITLSPILVMIVILAILFKEPGQ